jgi:hypothetical protein
VKSEEVQIVQKFGVCQQLDNVQCKGKKRIPSKEMKLSPREVDHLVLSQVGLLAQRRLARGTRLSCPEAIALIAHVVMEKARDGMSSVRYVPFSY